jgi:hypothetical protein
MGRRHPAAPLILGSYTVYLGHLSNAWNQLLNRTRDDPELIRDMNFQCREHTSLIVTRYVHARS